MIKFIKKISSVVLICSLATSIVCFAQTKQKEESKLSTKKIIYSINNKAFGLETLPKAYGEAKGKERKKFLNLFINNKIVLDTLNKEQITYKKEINSELSKAEAEWKRKGIILDSLSKKVTVQKATLDLIAYLEVEKLDKNISKTVEKFYKDKKTEYLHENGIEISLIATKTKEEAKKLLKNKNDTALFERTWKKSILNKNKKSSYGGFITEKSSKEFFDKLWKSKEIGVYSEIIKYKNNYFIVYIHQRKEKEILPFNEVKKDIKRYLLQAKKESFLGRKQKKALASSKVIIYDVFDNNYTKNILKKID